MSNTPHRADTPPGPETKAEGQSFLFVIVLLVAVASVLAFIAFHSYGPRPNVLPATHASPAVPPGR